MLTTTLSPGELTEYVSRQLSGAFPDREVKPAELEAHVASALERLEHCFSHVHAKYYFDGKTARFDHLHTDQYASFLYLLSNTIHRRGGDLRLASKIYALNKALHALDVYYEVELPSIFCFQHCVGTVIGRATFGDYLYVYQRVTIGGSFPERRYPRFGQGVVLFSGACVTGEAVIGDNVWFSINAVVMDETVEDNSIVFGRSPRAERRTTSSRSVRRDFFGVSHD
jgi:serine O-acetyltransferase